MSIEYCHKCSQHYDTDFDPECPRCDPEPDVETLRIDAEMSQERYLRAARDARLKEEGTHGQS